MKITDDYIAWLDIDLSFQNIDMELSNFTSMYGPPNGLFRFNPDPTTKYMELALA